MQRPGSDPGPSCLGAARHGAAPAAPAAATAPKSDRPALAPGVGHAYLLGMKRLLLIAVLALAPTAAFAASCPDIPDDSSTHNIDNETALTLCRAQALHDATAAKAQQLQVQSDLAAAAKNFELELKMQQTMDAAATPPVVLPIFPAN